VYGSACSARRAAAPDRADGRGLPGQVACAASALCSPAAQAVLAADQQSIGKQGKQQDLAHRSGPSHACCGCLPVQLCRLLGTCRARLPRAAARVVPCAAARRPGARAERGRCGGRRLTASRSWAWTRSASTPTAAWSRWATRSAAPVRGAPAARRATPCPACDRSDLDGLAILVAAH